MLNNYVIEPSSSPWISPILLVKKEDGSQYCYRKGFLYSFTRDSRYLKTLDITSAFIKYHYRKSGYVVPNRRLFYFCQWVYITKFEVWKSYWNSSSFSRLAKARFTLHKDKCHFCKGELGYVVGAKGLMVNFKKVEAIVKIPPSWNTPNNWSCFLVSRFYMSFLQKIKKSNGLPILTKSLLN